jgi:hypothetical protein
MKSKIIILFLFLCSAAWAGPWQEQSTGHFIFSYHDNNSRLMRQMMAVMEEQYRNLCTAWAVPAAQPIRVYLATDDQEFNTLTGQAIPDWGAGCAFPSSSTIVLKARSRPWMANSLSEIARHELSHVLLYQTVQGRPVPRWFDEGLAMRESQKWNWQQDLVMGRAVFTRSLAGLANVDNVLFFRESKAALAYAESFAALSFLTGKIGQDRLKGLIGNIGPLGFATAFTAAAGLDFSWFDREFLENAYKKYQWRVLFTDEYIWWIAVVALFLLAYLATKYRTHRIIKRWSEEEDVPHVL